MSTLKINFITLFPKYFEVFKNESIIKRAIQKKIIEIKIIDIRDYGLGKVKQVDDKPYGGGPGMLLMVEPIDKALENLKGYKILLTPQGKFFNQKEAYKLSKFNELTFIAGHYEGFDERIRTLVDCEYSIGDFILTGGEIPAMAIADSVIRLVDNVIKKESIELESFSNNLLEFPQYTRPSSYKGQLVPKVLLNGNHKLINKWREEQSIIKTKSKRPDLFKKGE